MTCTGQNIDNDEATGCCGWCAAVSGSVLSWRANSATVGPGHGWRPHCEVTFTSQIVSAILLHSTTPMGSVAAAQVHDGRPPVDLEQRAGVGWA
jgi:hypothetical protein